MTDHKDFRTDGFARFEKNVVSVAIGGKLFDSRIIELNRHAGELIGGRNESGKHVVSGGFVIEHRNIFAGEAVRRDAVVRGGVADAEALVAVADMIIGLAESAGTDGGGHGPAFAEDADVFPLRGEFESGETETAEADRLSGVVRHNRLNAAAVLKFDCESGGIVPGKPLSVNLNFDLDHICFLIWRWNFQ